MSELSEEEKQLLNAAERSLRTGTPLVRCPDCGKPMQLAEGRHGLCLQCPDYTCKASHSATPDGSPTGIPGDRKTRKARIHAHQALSILWEQCWMYNKGSVYSWLSRAMCVPRDQCKLSMFSEEQCHQVMRLVDEWLGACIVAYSVLGERIRYEPLGFKPRAKFKK